MSLYPNSLHIVQSRQLISQVQSSSFDPNTEESEKIDAIQDHQKPVMAQNPVVESEFKKQSHSQNESSNNDDEEYSEIDEDNGNQQVEDQNNVNQVQNKQDVPETLVESVENLPVNQEEQESEVIEKGTILIRSFINDNNKLNLSSWIVRIRYES